jgi:BirA family biotin operon repressor/biotin-[acetyl-CoA-carboxylase] ligase
MTSEQLNPNPSGPQLNQPAILAALRQISADASLLDIQVEQTLDSTNDHMARLRAQGSAPDVVVANEQTAGRGRRGRRWISPPGAGLYLSIRRSFNRPVSELGALSLVAGLAAAEALEACCGVIAGLKWPNDVQIDGRKLAGCLIDIEGSPTTPTAIIGIGINIDFRGQLEPDQPWTDVASVNNAVPDRNKLAALLISQLHQYLSEFDTHGFNSFQAQWARRDVLYGQEVSAIGAGEQSLAGRAMGLDQHGRLLLEDHGVTRALASGEVSLLRRV